MLIEPGQSRAKQTCRQAVLRFARARNRSKDVGLDLMAVMWNNAGSIFTNDASEKIFHTLIRRKLEIRYVFS
jgi:hypothetical protein